MCALSWRRLRVVVLASAFASTAGATDIVGLGAELPEVRFDLPRTVTVRDPQQRELPSTLSPGERLLRVDLPVSVVVSKGDVDRVAEVVIEVDGSAAGLTVHTYSPATRLESEFAGDIETRTTTESDRHLDGSLGGVLPNPTGSIAQLTPTISGGASGRETETTTVSRVAPKEAIVVAVAINRRRGVLYKFRPSPQTTLEGEHQLSITFVAPAEWSGGELSVRCSAGGERKLLFVKQRKIWGSNGSPVALRLAGQATPDPPAAPASRSAKRQTVAKPPIEESLWKARKRFENVGEAGVGG